MPTAKDAAEYVFEGIWTNLQKGKVIGLTLTVNQFHAAILSPALAVLIAIAGAQLWRLFQYAIHQARATSEPRDFLFHQQQVSLRNTSADIDALWRLIRLAFAWRHQKGVHVLRRTLPLLFWTTLHLLLVITAGLFSSTLLNAGDQVLSRSPWCGWFNESFIDQMYAPGRLSDDTIKMIMEFSSYINTAYANVQQQVDICSASPTTCNSAPTKMLNFTHNIIPGGCPFEQSICHPSIDGSIQFDSGYLSSFSAFGFNAAKVDRIAYRLVAECAPLDDARHVSPYQTITTTNETTTSYQIADAHYGPSSITERNATFSTVKQYSTCEQRKVTSPYLLSAQYAFADGSIDTGTASFDPIPQLQRFDADTTLILMSFDGVYQGPVTDPWFSAQHAATENRTYCDHEERTLYSRDLPITTIGCTQQFQICNQDNGPNTNSTDSSCTPLLPFYQLQDSIDSTSNLKLTPLQHATYIRLATQASNGVLFSDIISYLSQSNTVPLQSRHLLDKTVSLALPATQWQTETTYWFSILLTYLQQVSLQISTGQFVGDTGYINRTLPAAAYVFGDGIDGGLSGEQRVQQDAAYTLCQSQMIRSHSYVNFDFFALVVVVVLCILIIVMGLFVDDVIGYLRHRRLQRLGEGNDKQDMWMLNSDLEMLRVISEVRGAAGAKWQRSSTGVPFTRAGCEVGILEVMGGKDKVGQESTTNRMNGRVDMNDDVLRTWRAHEKSGIRTSVFEEHIVDDGGGDYDDDRDIQRGCRKQGRHFAPGAEVDVKADTDSGVIVFENDVSPFRHGDAPFTFSSSIPDRI